MPSASVAGTSITSGGMVENIAGRLSITGKITIEV